MYNPIRPEWGFSRKVCKSCYTNVAPHGGYVVEENIEYDFSCACPIYKFYASQQA
jgi:hypothetical protein